MEPPKYFIYALVDPRTEEVRYIGKTTFGVKRVRQHGMPSSLKRDRNRDRNPFKTRWIESLQRDGLSYDFHVLESFDTSEPLAEAEKFWIASARYVGCNLTNLTAGGDGQCGWKPRPETRQKISQANRGRSLSDETRRKMSEVRKGRPKSAATRARMAAWQRGRTLTPEHRANLSRARRAMFEKQAA